MLSIEDETIHDYFPLVIKYGTFFESIKVNTLTTMSTNILFMARRLLTACILVFLSWQSMFQLFSHMILTMLWIYHVYNNKTYETRAQNRIELMNEVFHMLITYTFLLFTDFVADLEMRQLIGWTTIGLIGTLISVNVIMMINAQIHEYYKNKAK